jgi:hypothetical protein
MPVSPPKVMVPRHSSETKRPVLLDASALRSARALEIDHGGQRHCFALDGRSAEALLATPRPASRSRISYLG